MRTQTLLPSALALLLAFGAATAAHARDELSASGTRLAIGGGAPRFYMTYGHGEEAELFAPIIPELKRLDILFQREGDGYAVYYKGQRQGEPWMIIRSREEVPETRDEPFVLLLGGSVFVPVRKIAELFPVQVRWVKGENLMTLSPDLKRPAGPVAARPRTGSRPPANTSNPPLPPSAAAPIGGTELTGVELRPEGGSLRLVVHASNRIVPTTLYVKNPDRIVLDFPGARWAEGLALPPGAGDVRGVRNGYFQPPANPNALSARLVLELNSPQAKILGLTPGANSVVASVGRENRRMARADSANEVQRALERRRNRSPKPLPTRRLPNGLDGILDPARNNIQPGIGGSLAGRLICLDAGHGGRDGGSVGQENTEKVLCLSLCQELQRELESRGARVLMTRSDDRYISPYDRTALANAANAEIFISIHLNASGKRNTASGTETYWYTPQSFPLAQSLHARMLTAVGKADRGVKNYRWIVCHSAAMPSVLLEVAFITNRTDEKLLASPQLHQNLAVQLAEGVVEYFATLPPASR